MAPLRAAQGPAAGPAAGPHRLADRLSPELAAALRVAPAPGSRARAGLGPGRRLPGRIPARGPRRAVVGMLTGCVQQVFFPEVNAATARVLAAEGCDVVIPAGQGCCGALSLHGGRRDEAAGFARRLIDEFERAGVDAIIVNSAGCGSAMKEYGELLRRGWRLGAAGGRAEPGRSATSPSSWSSSARSRPGTRCRSASPITTPATSAHAQQITAQPRDAAARHTRPAPRRGRRRRHLLRVRGHLQPGAAGGGPRARRAQGRRGRGDRRAPAGLGEPGLRAADRLGAGRPRGPAADGRTSPRCSMPRSAASRSASYWRPDALAHWRGSPQALAQPASPWRDALAR